MTKLLFVMVVCLIVMVAGTFLEGVPGEGGGCMCSLDLLLVKLSADSNIKHQISIQGQCFSEL